MPTDARELYRRWATGGMAHLTRTAEGVVDFSRAPILAAAERIARPLGQDANTLLTGRAALTGWSGRGSVSAGGAAYLLSAADGPIAISVARDSDRESLPALLETQPPINDSRRALADVVRLRDSAEFVDRARLLGIPAAVLGEVEPRAPRSITRWARTPRPIGPDLLVVDLSAMGAGPLCGRILADLGATVVKVESPTRPDGTRTGSPTFFRWMNGAKVEYAADLHADNARLGRLLDAAGVVIEASRPRALQQAGLDADTRAPRAGRVWVRITGYGPDHPMRVAFGDDAAVAGGLVGRSSTGPIFCGDALADPLTGLTAAHEVVASLRRGGGEVIDVAMAEVAATYADLEPPSADLAEHPVDVEPPTVPEIVERRPTLDPSDVERLVDARLAAPC